MDEHQDPYERLREECERRGYDAGFMIRFAAGLADRRDRGIKILAPAPKKPGGGRKRKIQPVSAYIDGKKLFTFQSLPEAAEAMHVSTGSIRSCCRGAYHTAGRYKDKKIVWRFENQENKENE